MPGRSSPFPAYDRLKMPLVEPRLLDEHLSKSAIAVPAHAVPAHQTHKIRPPTVAVQVVIAGQTVAAVADPMIERTH
jgi:hypothetical protein